MIILVDIDKTITYAHGRDGLIVGEGPGDWWDAYHAASIDDEPVQPMLDLLATLSLGGAELIGFTGRPERWRSLTLRWMLRHNAALDELLMRPDDDYQKTAACKLCMLRRRFPGEASGRVVILDDDADCVAVYRDAGYTTLAVSVL